MRKELEAAMTKSLQEALTRIEKAEDKFASLDPELQMN